MYVPVNFMGASTMSDDGQECCRLYKSSYCRQSRTAPHHRISIITVTNCWYQFIHPKGYMAWLPRMHNLLIVIT